jgi:uncharacterized protein (DUF3084 family)
MLTVVIGGLGVLVALAALIGIALDREARNGAWTRIAAARRDVAERTRELEQREVAVAVREAELDAREQALARREAALERRRRERYDQPPDISA